MRLNSPEVGGLVVAAVGDHELDVGCLASRDHSLGICHAGGHGLLAEHVLAGLAARMVYSACMELGKAT